MLWESDYAPAYYVPMKDVGEGILTPTDHETYCPYKGNASYWTIGAGGVEAQNAVWGYKTPYDEPEMLKGHVAFYPDKVEFRVESEPVHS